jgi:hypothetical protein
MMVIDCGIYMFIIGLFESSLNMILLSGTGLELSVPGPGPPLFRQTAGSTACEQTVSEPRLRPKGDEDTYLLRMDTENYEISGKGQTIAHDDILLTLLTPSILCSSAPSLS